MREQVESLIRAAYDDVLIWEYVETRQQVYIRFTGSGALYLATLDKSSKARIEYFKHEGSVRL